MKLKNKVINQEQTKVIFQDIQLEKNIDSVKSIDNVICEIVEEDDKIKNNFKNNIIC